MMNFRKILLLAGVVFCAISCFGDGPSYETSHLIDTTFELPYNFGSDSLYFDDQGGKSIVWQDIAFYHHLDETPNAFRSGFILSCLKGSGSGDGRFRVNSGTGMDDSSNYMVYYNPNPSRLPDKDIEFVAIKYGSCEVLGCYVNNTKEVVDSIRNNFVVEDKLVLKMTGYMNGQKTASQEFVLAEYTSDEQKVVTEWTAFILDQLKLVEYVDVEIISSNKNVPSAFCLDDFVANVSISF